MEILCTVFMVYHITSWILSTMSARLRHKPAHEEEDAAALKLGPGLNTSVFFLALHPIVLSEFNNAGCLLISEVKYLLENRDKDAPDTAYA
jgi:DNA-directed RNA polymerase II subunit RPB4